MQALLDHLGALIIGSVVLLVMAVVSLKSFQDNSDLTVNYMIASQTYSLVDLIEHDIENLRPASLSPPGLQFKCGVRDNVSGANPYTDVVQFMSLSEPGATDVVMVQYEILPVAGADSIDVVLNQTDGRYAMYDFVRSIDDGTGLKETHRWSNLLSFDVDLIRMDGTTQTPPNPSKPSYGCTENNPPEYTNLIGTIRVQLVAAAPHITDIDPDKVSNANLNVFHYSKVIRPMNLF